MFDFAKIMEVAQQLETAFNLILQKLDKIIELLEAINNDFPNRD